MMTLIEKNPTMARKQLLGNILLGRGMITQSQIKHVLQIQEKKGGYFGKLLVDLGYISEYEIVIALVIQCHIPYIAIDQYDIDQSTLKLVPREIARKYHVVPLNQVNRILSIVMADPLDIEAKNELQHITNCRLVPFIATHGEIEKAINLCYDLYGV
jgi:type IV pilus assembly protein PilB